MSASGVWTILLAAGMGRRFGGAKLLRPLGTASVLERSLRTATTCSEGVVLVLPPSSSGADGFDDAAADGFAAAFVASAASRTANLRPPGIVAVPGGATRSESVRCGLAATPEGAEVILVHDAARPLASGALYAEVTAAVRSGADGAAPVVQVADTIRDLRAGNLERPHLRAVQTPQAFRAQALRSAHRQGGEATDDASLLEAAGGSLVLVEGELSNIKITTPVDLAVAAALLRL